MSALLDVYIKAETLQTILDTLNKKDEKGISITLSINDEANEYGQNVSAFVSQSKEARADKKPKFYVGNGKVFWTDGTVKSPEKKVLDIPGFVDEKLPF